jgi:hypothetical protein
MFFGSEHIMACSVATMPLIRCEDEIRLLFCHGEICTSAPYFPIASQNSKPHGLRLSSDALLRKRFTDNSK